MGLVLHSDRLDTADVIVGGVALILLGGIVLSGGSGVGWILLVAGVLLLIAGRSSQPSNAPSRPRQASAHGSVTTAARSSAAPVHTPTAAPAPNPTTETTSLEAPALQRPPAMKPPVRKSPASVEEPVTARPAQIVTRTTARAGMPALLDPFAGLERTWSADEDRRLLGEYAQKQDMIAIAVAMRIDQREVAKRLIRLVFDSFGDLDAGDPPQNGTRWSASDFDQAVREVNAGRDLVEIAAELGRTPLGVGWRLLERAPQPFAPSKQTRARLGLIPT